jgi:HPr kinase/phosphorylase
MLQAESEFITGRTATISWQPVQDAVKYHVYRATVQPIGYFLGTGANVSLQIPGTDQVITRIILFLADEFSPETNVHGTALDCYGVGCLIVGMPGIGKSETALELVERGHRLVADDMVKLRRSRDDYLYAETNPIVEHHMEIRGVGIIDVKSVFGVGRVRNSKRIGLMIELEEWKRDKDYDRTGLTEEHKEIMGVRVPYLTIPVRPGRNIAIIIEVAALNYRLKELGVHPAAEFNKRLMDLMSENAP